MFWKKYSLYIQGTPRKTKGIYTNWAYFFFHWNYEILSATHTQQFYSATFTPWCKVNWMKFRPLVYLDPCQTSMMELFSEYRWLLLGVHFFHRNDTSYMFYRVLNASLKSIWYSNGKIVRTLNWTRVESKYPWTVIS